jgi:hypothetical protein
MRPDFSRLLFIGPSPDDPDPALALRGNMRFEVEGDRLTVTCPYCGAVAKKRLRAGTIGRIEIVHEDWCPVPTDRELAGRTAR